MGEGKSKSGIQMIAIGIAILAITLIVFGVSSGNEVSGGRGSTLMLVGIPFGAAAIVIGIVQLSRGRK
jgi:hypothetical protein